IFEIVNHLREAGNAILYTTHYMEEAERLCDRNGIMAEGKLVAMVASKSFSPIWTVRKLWNCGDCRAASTLRRFKPPTGCAASRGRTESCGCLSPTPPDSWGRCKRSLAGQGSPST